MYLICLWTIYKELKSSDTRHSVIFLKRSKFWLKLENKSTNIFKQELLNEVNTMTKSMLSQIKD